MPRLLLALALGATSAFLFDPQQGRRRRALLRDKVTRTVNEGREFTDAAMKDLRHRAQGISVRARSWRAGATADDIVAAAYRERFALLQDSWTPGVRLLIGGAGALLLLYALSRSGLGGIGALAAGAALLGRASANRPLTSLVPQRTREAG